MLSLERCRSSILKLSSPARAALGLLEAVQSGSIRQDMRFSDIASTARQLSSRLSMARELGLDNAAFPDAAGVGVLQLALEKLEEEKVWSSFVAHLWPFRN